MKNIPVSELDKKSESRSSLCAKCQIEPRRKSGFKKLESWLNKNMKIQMTDGRTLIGTFLCTDRDCNVILGSCSEFLRADEGGEEEPRVLGLAMVPGHHILSICLDSSEVL